MAERVQKILAQWGIASRRRAEEMIVAGRVRRNGKIVQLGEKADPEKDHLEIDGKKLTGQSSQKIVYTGQQTHWCGFYL